MQPSWRAVRKNLAPILLIQSVGAILVASYFLSQGVRDFAQRIAEVKQAGGVPFAFLAGFIAGGLLPEIAKFLTGRRHRYSRTHVVRVLWTGFVYGLIGILIFYLYDLQARWFGNGIDWGTLTLKTSVDMGIFTPLVSVPMAAALFAWWKAEFAWTFWAKVFSRKFYREEVVSKLPLCWAYWIPFLYLTYALPIDLQFPFAIVAESAWSILFVFMVTDP